MTETALEALRQLTAAALAGLTVYQCWTHKMRLTPVLISAAAGAVAWWAISPAVLGGLLGL